MFAGDVRGNSECIEAGSVATVRLEAISWLTPVFDTDQKVRLKWEEEVEKGATLRSLFTRLTDKYPKFGELVYDPGEGAITGLVSVIFNDRVLELAGGLDANIQDGDSIVLLPAYAGGTQNVTPAKEGERGR
jgi:molybdopterin converting factor small subunit